MLSMSEFSLLEFDGSNYLRIGSLVEEANREGYAFVQRTMDEWENGINCFSEIGEGLWGLVDGAQLIEPPR